MQKYTDTVIQDGKPISGLVVTVANHPAGTPATIFSATGAQVSEVKTDGAGRFEFYAPNGHYSLTVSGSGINPYTLNDIVLFDPVDAGAAATIGASGGTNVQAALDAKATASALATKAPLDSPRFTGNMGIGTANPSEKLDVRSDTAGTNIRVSTTDNGNVLSMGWKAGASYIAAAGYNSPALSFETGGGERARFDASGNLLVGATSGICHVIRKSVGEGTLITALEGQSGGVVIVQSASNSGWNSANTAMFIAKNSSTGRSINAAGTVNASGADYAEYMTKADCCGVIAKGAIVGVNAAGHLVDKWAESVSFRIKSTDPSYVGGDVWGSEEALGTVRPQQPGFEAPTYAGAPHPGDLPDEATDDERLAYAIALSQFKEDQQAHAAAVAAARKQFDTVTMPAYDTALAQFEALLEAARQKVDRIAFCGQVPVNVLGATPGQYVVPVQVGEGIGAQLVNKSSLTLAQYMSAVGRVQNILPDGRANVVVKVI